MHRTTLVALAFLAACTEGEIVLDLDEPALPEPAAYAAGRVILAFGDTPPESVDAAGLHLKAIRLTPTLGMGLYALPAGIEVSDAVLRLRESGRFAAVDADLRVQTTADVLEGPGSDPYRSYQWNMDAIDMQDAWRTSLGEGVIVAIIDTGVSSGTDGFDSLLKGWDFVNEDADASDDNGHGTHVAGTVAERAGNGIGCAGVAPLASILPVKVLDAKGSGWSSDVVAGIEYAVANGADVINLSLGSPTSSTTLAVAALAAREKGVIVVAASGNDGKSVVSYPGANPGVLAVGATDAADARASYSNAGPELDFVAPGGDTRNDLNGDGVADGILQETIIGGEWSYRLYQGTSMATPHVAGAFALVLGAGATPDEAEAALRYTSSDLGDAGDDDIFGMGLIQVGAALAAFEPTPEEPEEPEEPEQPEQPGDVTGPVVSDLEITQLESGRIRVAWSTDELATSRMCKPDGSICLDSPTGLSTEHRGRARRAGRYFVIEATDEAGNTTTSGPHLIEP